MIFLPRNTRDLNQMTNQNNCHAKTKEPIWRSYTSRLLATWLAAFLLVPIFSSARTTYAANQGFQINRYEPTTSGEWSIMVDHPWYSNTRRFSAGFTLNYGHNPLVFLSQNPATGLYEKSDVIIANQLTGHLNLALALWKLNFSLSLPLTLFENGNQGYGIGPSDSVSVGDPRIGVLFQAYKDPQNSPFSISIGANVWIPLRKFTDKLPQQSSEQEVRVLPKIIFAGAVLNKHILWSATAGYLWRPDSIVGNQGTLDGRSAGPELQIGASLKYADFKRRFAIGPEAMLRTTAMGDRIFKADHTSLEVMLTAFYNIGGVVNLKGGVGMGILTAPGTTDFRAILGIDFATMHKEKEAVKVPLDTDKDGIMDEQDICPAEPKGDHPDPKRLGCPDKDSDNDGIYDSVDACPNEAGVSSTDPKKHGCPEELISLEDGELKILQPVLFDTDKDTIKPESIPVLTQIANYLKQHPEVRKLRIEGHTDSTATPGHNKKLSQKRVNAVANWLVSQGISQDTLDAKGFGEQCPIADNKTEDGKAKNRRVVFVVVEPVTPGIVIIPNKCFQYKNSETFIGKTRKVVKSKSK